MEKKYWSSRIHTLVPYVPGEHPRGQTFIKLNTNENPYPPSPMAMEAIRAATNDELRLYPDPASLELREALAEYYNLKPEQVFCGNGSDEVLGLCFYALFDPHKKVLFPDITYSFYPVYTELFGIDYEEIPLNEDFSLPAERYMTGECGGMVICNPNAPTGQTQPVEVIRRILEANPQCVVLVDEAYADFGTTSVVPLVDEYPNLLVVGTMSKSRSLAGLRIGFALGHPDLIAGVNCVKDSFNSYPVDRIAQAAGIAAVRDVEYFNEIRHKVMATRDKTTVRLRQLGFEVQDSDTNFIFARHPGKPGRELAQMLRERGILVRRFDSPRIEEYLRISIGTDEEMEQLCAICEEILKG